MKFLLYPIHIYTLLLQLIVFPLHSHLFFFVQRLKLFQAIDFLLHPVDLGSQLRLYFLKIFNSLIEGFIQTHQVFNLNFKLFFLRDHKFLVLLFSVLFDPSFIIFKLLSKNFQAMQSLISASLLSLQILNQEFFIPFQIFNSLLQIVNLISFLHFDEVFLLSRSFVLFTLLFEPLDGLYKQILLLKQCRRKILYLLKNCVSLVKRLHARGR